MSFNICDLQILPNCWIHNYEVGVHKLVKEKIGDQFFFLIQHSGESCSSVRVRKSTSVPHHHKCHMKAKLTVQHKQQID